ncbi:MAG: hypothetical protein EP340_00540 [Alphaproteobacteria bacterium]|nr:MAG: hypothetical protein EP340_00540 [Alphaproteobacteria bacterium]
MGDRRFCHRGFRGRVGCGPPAASHALCLPRPCCFDDRDRFRSGALIDARHFLWLRRNHWDHFVTADDRRIPR